MDVYDMISFTYHILDFLQCLKALKVESVPVSPGSSLTHQTSTCSLPLPKEGTVVAELLFQHAVVPEVLLAASSREGLYKLLLKQNQVEFMGNENLDAKKDSYCTIYDHIYLEADFAFTPLSIPFMETDHKSLIAFLPI